MRYAGEVNAGVWDINETAASVARLYFGALGRTPDAGGLGGWTSAIESGTSSLSQVAGAFVGGAEFQTSYGALDNTKFVQKLYLNVLARSAGAAETTSWVNTLNAGTARADVALAFTESSEFQIKVIGQIDRGIVVSDAYMGF